MKTHKDLDVWQRGIQLVLDVYTITKGFPKEDIYSLVSQMRRAAVSIPSNIAEGAARKYDKEFVQFLYIAIGSLSELETQIIIGEKLNYISPEMTANLYDEISDIKKMLLGLIKYV